jgi:hypothetical protein
MSSRFNPIEEPDLYCRFCEKIIPAQLDRRIAENGKSTERSSIYEYYCTKCFKTTCFPGSDLIDETERKNDTSETLRVYSPRDHFFIGEYIRHCIYDETGLVVGKENSSPSKILVHFPVHGLKKLIQDL